MQQPAKPLQQEGGTGEGLTGRTRSLSTQDIPLNSYSLAASSKGDGHQIRPSSPQTVARQTLHNGRSASSHGQPHLGEKPAIPEKSALVLMAAREILSQKRKRLERSASDSELYDDAISYRTSCSGAEGGSVSEEDTYDDVISVLASSDNDGIYDDVIAMLAASKEDELYDDALSMMATGNNILYDNILRHPDNTTEDSTSRARPDKPVKPTWLSELLAPKLARQVSRRHSFDEIYDDTVVRQTRRLGRPNKPEKPASLQRNAKVMRLLQQLREKSSQAKSQQSPHGPRIEEDNPQSLPLISIAGVQPSDSNMSGQLCIGSTTHNGITAPLPVSQQQSRDHHRLGIPRAREGQKESDYLSLLPPSPMAAHRRVRTPPGPGGKAPEREGQANGRRHTLASSPAMTEESPYENESIVGGRRVQYRERKKAKFNFGSFSGDSIPQLATTATTQGEEGKLTPTTSVSSTDIPRRQKTISRSDSSPHPSSNDYEAPDSPTPPSDSHLPANRRTYDPLPDIEEARPHYVEYLASLRAPESIIEEADPYEYLPLYEDLHQFQEEGGEGYQDLDGAITQALGLPEQMRERVRRITRKQRTKMQKSIKYTRRKVQRSQTLPASDLGEMHVRGGAMFEEDMSHARLSSDPTSNSSKPKEGGNGESGNEEEATSGCDRTGGNKEPNEKRGAEGGVAEGGSLAEVEGSDSSADENESVPFGKSRVVFEMLLDASGIQRAPEGEPASQQTEHIEPSVAEEDSGSDEGPTSKQEEAVSSPFFDSQELDRIYDTPELRHYHEAGIIQPRSKSELDEEIRRITSSAPSDPPPLPGFLRPRTRVMTRTDKLLHKRFLLKRRQRLKNTPAVVSVPKGGGVVTSLPPGAPPSPSTAPPPSHGRTLASQSPPPSSPRLSSTVPPTTSPQHSHPTAVRPESEITYQNLDQPMASQQAPTIHPSVPPTTAPQQPHPTAIRDSSPESEVTYQNVLQDQTTASQQAPTIHTSVPPATAPQQSHPTAVRPESEDTYQNLQDQTTASQQAPTIHTSVPPTTIPQQSHPTAVRDSSPESEVTYQNLDETTASQQAPTIHPSVPPTTTPQQSHPTPIRDSSPESEDTYQNVLRDQTMASQQAPNYPPYSQ